jgi:hypothetical protein
VYRYSIAYNGIVYTFGVKFHEERLVKVPLEEIRGLVRKESGTDLTGIEPSIEGEFLVFVIGAGPRDAASTPANKGEQKRRRRRIRKRNRVKTRGWNIVGQITNSKGLIANIYEPFVLSLKEAPLPRTEQRKLVRQIMIRNGNRPSEGSVDYFLENTLEFLRKKSGG